MKYRLTIYPDIGEPGLSTSFLFETKKELIAAHDTAASLLLFLQDQAQLMPDCINMFFCEKEDGIEWEEIEI